MVPYGGGFDETQCPKWRASALLHNLSYTSWRLQLCLHAESSSNRGRPENIVICSVEHDLEVVEAALKAGALGYVFKTHAARDLNVAVKSVARGRSFVSAQ